VVILKRKSALGSCCQQLANTIDERKITTLEKIVNSAFNRKSSGFCSFSISVIFSWHADFAAVSTFQHLIKAGPIIPLNLI
jgi:hypothetical protein